MKQPSPQLAEKVPNTQLSFRTLHLAKTCVYLHTYTHIHMHVHVHAHGRVDVCIRAYFSCWYEYSAYLFFL